MIITYLSIEIAIKENTEAHIDKTAINCDILQYNLPNGQCELSI